MAKLQAAESVNDLLDAVDRKVAKAVTPNIVPKGAMVLQPNMAITLTFYDTTTPYGCAAS